MERILVSFVFIALNLGLHFSFVSYNKFNISKNFKIIFFLFFLVTSLFWIFSENPNFNLIRISISLLGLYLIGILVFKFFHLRYFQRLNIKFRDIIIHIIKFIIMPIYTVFVTAVQILLLFNIL
jgi:hypothetical protein